MALEAKLALYERKKQRREPSGSSLGATNLDGIVTK